MADFDSLLSVRPREGQPNKSPATGDKKAHIDHAIQKSREGKKPYAGSKYRGIVVWTSPVTFQSFKQKYDQVFIDFCMSNNKKSKNQKTKKVKILETLVYIPEICACLPSPPVADRFFSLVKKYTLGLKLSENIEEQFRKEEFPQHIAELTRHLAQIHRYPYAYMVQRGNSEATEVSLGSTVRVSFPHNYDFSHGLITSVDKKG